MIHLRHAILSAAATLFLAGSGPVLAAPAKPTCTEAADYVVIARERTDAVGTDFLIRQKLKGAKPAACVFKPQSGDVRYPKPGNDDTGTLMGVAGNRMVLDSGTGTVRTIVVVDLATGKDLLRQVAYQNPTLADGKVTFFADGPQGTRDKCPDLSDDMLATSKLEPEKILDVATLSVRATGKIECHYEE